MSDSTQSARKALLPFAEAGAWLVFVILAFIYTFQFDDPLPVYEWGPAHWPRVVLFGLLTAALWLLYSEWQHTRIPALRQMRESVEDDLDQLQRSMQIRIGFIFGLPVVYTFLIHKMGFLLVTPFFLFVYMWLMGVRKLRTLIIVTVSVSAALAIVFVKLIFTYLPPGAGVFNTINGYILGWLS